MLDGYLKIKTKLDNKGIEKDIIELENKMKKLQENNAQLSQDERGLQEEINNYEKLRQEAKEYKQKIKELKSEKDRMLKENPELSVVRDTPEYANIKKQIEDLRTKYANANAEIDKQAPKIEKVEAKLNKVKTKQTENNAKIEEFKQKIEKVKLNKIQSNIENIGHGIQKQVKGLGRMAFAIIGIRTAWGAVKSAISMVSQYNEQVSTDFEYMRYCIASMLVPAVQWLISLLYTVLGYVNSIMQAWFGVNIFGNASVKNFQKMKNNASGTAKAVKDIQKSLQGFDEMNILQDNSKDSSNSGTPIPSMDLSGMQANVPKWLQWIMDNKDVILAVLAGIGTAILTIKLGLSGIKALGIGVLVAGIVLAIEGLLEYLKDPSWENFGKIIIGVGVAILGLGVIIGSLPVALIGAILAIDGLLIKNWDKIKGKLDEWGGWLHGKFEELQKWLGEKLDWLPEKWGDVGKVIKGAIQIFVLTITTLIESIFKTIVGIYDKIFSGAKQILDGIIKIFKGDFKGGLEDIAKGLLKIFVGIWEGMSFAFVTAWNTIIGLFNNGGEVFKGFTEGISGIFKTVVNWLIGGINTVINSAFGKINGLLNNIRGISIANIKPFEGLWSYNPIPVPQIPKLAKGGIISQPTQAIIGEARKRSGNATRK